MATDNVTSPSPAAPWTPRDQLANHKLKVIRLIELGENEKGRFAKVEFEDESSRPLYLLTIEDAWSRVFHSLDFADQWKIRDHFNRRFPAQKLPDGSVKKFKHVSFVTETVSSRRKYLGVNHFDLAMQDSPNGKICGLNIAREFLEYSKLSNVCHGVGLTEMITSLAEAKQSKRDERANHAAWKFLHVMSEMLRFAARHADFNGYIDRCVEDALRTEQFLAEREAKQKSDFVARMKKAREEKQKPTEDELQSEGCEA